MPTYDYECGGCGHTKEVFQTFSEKPLKKCPQCGAKKFARLIGSGAGVIFKGSGFYGTDYRSDSYKTDAKKDTETTPKSAAGDCSGNPKACSGPCST